MQAQLILLCTLLHAAYASCAADMQLAKQGICRGELVVGTLRLEGQGCSPSLSHSNTVLHFLCGFVQICL